MHKTNNQIKFYLNLTVAYYENVIVELGLINRRQVSKIHVKFDFEIQKKRVLKPFLPPSFWKLL